MTGKEYFTNRHIMSKYFELVFLQLQLVKISCKLITNRLSYKKNKKNAFFMKHHVLTAYRKSPLPYPMVPSQTPYNLPFSYNTA